MHCAVVLPSACCDEVCYPNIYSYYRCIGCGLDHNLLIIGEAQPPHTITLVERDTTIDLFPLLRLFIFQYLTVICC